MEIEAVQSWPLPVGHRFGQQGFDLRNHDGRTSIHESAALRQWQRGYRHRIKRVDFPAGYYDSITQKAVVHVQELAGLPRTGLIDQDTWAAVWTVEKPVVAPPAEKKPPSARVLRLRTKRLKDYWRRVSQRVAFVADGSQPPWWPGRPFGPGEYGWHVEVVQDLVQARKTGLYNRETSARVRALRRIHGLPVSDVMDLALAVALDPGPWA